MIVAVVLVWLVVGVGGVFCWYFGRLGSILDELVVELDELVVATRCPCTLCMRLANAS